MKRVYGLISLVLIVLLIVRVPIEAHSEDNIVVVTTLSYLKPDIERILCNGVVYSVVQAGVDPHEYQLKPSDIDLLKRANLIVSTGHTNFEMRIKELVEAGEINATLLNIMEIHELRILENPTTRNSNYHMVVNDPFNYIVFLAKLAQVLAEIDPIHAECYYTRYIDIVVNMTSILVKAGSLNVGVIVDIPASQYLVEWLGLRVLQVLKAEEEYQVTPGDYERAVNLIKNGTVKAVIVSKPGVDPASSKLLELAREYNLTIIWVNPPSSDSGVLDNLVQVVNQVKTLENPGGSGETGMREKTGGESTLLSQYWYVVFTTLSLVFLVLGYYLGSRRTLSGGVSS